MRRLFVFIVAILAGWLGTGAPAAVAAPTPTSLELIHVHTYDGASHSSPETGGTPQRGPPTHSQTITTAYDAVDRWSYGRPARPESDKAVAAAIDITAETALRQAGSTTTTQEQAEPSDWESSSLQRTGVAANTAARACRTNSFTGETLVLMADGARKPIKDVKLGDEVMASDPEIGETGPRKVVDLIRHSGPHTMVAVRLAGGTTIDATDRHPFWVESRGEWVDAIDLQPGDVLVAADGSRRTVSSMGISDQDLTAYNLTVAGLHTYFAGRDSVLVHNTGCTNIADLPASAVRNLTEDASYAFSRLSQNHGVTRIEFREQIHLIKRNENLPADFNLSFGPTGDVWNPRTGELIGSMVHGG